MLTEISLCVGDEVEHVLRDRTGSVRALATEEVERHTVGCCRTNSRVTQSYSDLRSIVRVLFFLETTVVAVTSRKIPIEVLVACLKVTLQSGCEHVGIYVLEEQARPGFKRTTAEEFQVAVSN